MKNREQLEEKVMQKDPSLVRTLLSKERTLLAKQRTAISVAQLGLGLAGFGFLVIRFFADPGHEWFLGLGILFVIASIFVFYHSFKLYRKFKHKLDHLHEKRGHLDKVYTKDFLCDEEF